MKEMASYDHVIRPWWVNRLIAYSIVSVFLVLATLDAFHLRSVSNSEGTKQEFIFAAIIYFIFEYRMLGFRVSLSKDKMIYRDRGMPWPRAFEIRREEIVSVRQMYVAGRKRFRAAQLELHLNATGDRKIIFNFSSFRPRDIQLILSWLPEIKR